ncbi:MAG: hypothetical protein K8T10_09130 [Candidatus Eremiobacteraeota bacterium]|nr:hypothetical protein [Candidatus Eremiobacteraeota bacterium]
MISVVIRRVALIFVVLLLVATFGLWWVSKPDARSLEEVKYTLVVYEKNPSNIKKIEGIIKQEGHDSEKAKAKRFKEKIIGYRIVQYFDKSELAVEYVSYLKGKKISARIKENPEGSNVYIQVRGNFKNKKKAEAFAKRVSKLIMLQFEVEENKKKFPYTTNKIVVRELANQEAADSLKSLLSAISKEVEIQEQSSDQDEEKTPSKKNPKSKAKQTNKPGDNGNKKDEKEKQP